MWQEEVALGLPASIKQHIEGAITCPRQGMSDMLMSGRIRSWHTSLAWASMVELRNGWVLGDSERRYPIHADSGNPIPSKRWTVA